MVASISVSEARAQKKAIVLGNGLVGSLMALDLAADDGYSVTVCDANEERLKATAAKANGRVATRCDVDFKSAASITEAVKGYDLAIGAVPGSMGFTMLEAVIRAGVSLSDISFMAEDYRQLDSLAKQHGVTTFEDVGVAPGSSSVLIGYACSQLDEVEDVTYYVTGLPTKPTEPFNYKLVFSPDDLIEEYVRPARLKKDGKVVVVPALSGCRNFNFKIDGITVPEMEGFFTDGSRTLLDTIPSPNVTEYTLRYPGTAARLEFLREIGLFDLDPVDVKGAPVRPRDVFAALAYPKMQLEDGENEFTFYHVEVTGRKDGVRKQHIFSLYAERDMKSGFSAMARTTGFPCVIVGRLIAEGILDMPGVNAPEAIGKNHRAVERLIEELERRGVTIARKVIDV